MNLHFCPKSNFYKTLNTFLLFGGMLIFCFVLFSNSVSAQKREGRILLPSKQKHSENMLMYEISPGVFAPLSEDSPQNIYHLMDSRLSETSYQGNLPSEQNLIPVTTEEFRSYDEQRHEILQERIQAGNVKNSIQRAIYSVDTRELRWSNGQNTIRAIAYYPKNAASGEKFPVILYSHGLGGAPNQTSYLGQTWASRGMISIHIHYPATDDHIWRGKIRPLSDLKNTYQQYWSSREQAAYISFVLDRLEEMQKSPDILGKHLDLSRVGVAGNDLGALASLLVAGQIPPDNSFSLKDNRISAVLVLSPPVYCTSAFGSVVYQDVKVPMMSFSGTDDDGLVGTTKASQRRIPFDSVSDADHFHVTLLGADHMVYGGHVWRSKQKGDSLYQNIIRNISTLYWEAYLLNRSEARDTLEFSDLKTFLRASAVMERVFVPENKQK